MANGRVIFHIDMNCYFASCEIAENPELKGKKIAIARQSLDNKSIILTASYEAKADGVKTTMPIFEALKICPDLMIVEPHMELYSEYSRKFFDYFLKITPLVEPASIDEGYLDVTDVCGPSEYLNLAKIIQNDLLNIYQLPCSIGIGPNKFLAKMASDMKKPLGITVLRKRDVEEKMWPLPINDLFGAGKKTCEVLRGVGINTIGDLAKFSQVDVLKSLLGDNTVNYLILSAYGNGDNNVDTSRFTSISSISNSQTLEHDEYDVEKILMLTKILSNSISMRLENNHLVAQTFTLQIKYNNFKTVSKSITLNQPTNNSYKMYQLFKEELDEIYNVDLGVRLVGVAAGKLGKSSEETKQLSIFDSLDNESKDLEVSKVISSINSLVGSQALKKGIYKNSKTINKYEKKN